MNKFQKFFLNGEACIQLYGPCSDREECEELAWLLSEVKERRLAVGNGRAISLMLSSIDNALRDGDDDDSESLCWTRDDAFSLFENIAAAKGCVFMLHPDLPGEAFLMTEAYYKEAFDD